MVSELTVIHGCRTLTINELIIRIENKKTYTLEYQ